MVSEAPDRAVRARAHDGHIQCAVFLPRHFTLTVTLSTIRRTNERQRIVRLTWHNWRLVCDGLAIQLGREGKLSVVSRNVGTLG